MKKIYRFLNKSFWFLVLSSSSFAMQTSEKLWTSLTVDGNYGLVVYYVEPQLRFIYATTPFQQFLNNMGAGYAVTSEWQFWMGQTFSADSQDAVAGSLDEYRIWEQALWHRQIDSTSIISRTRLEERKSLYFSEWAMRLRERLTISTPMTQNLSMVISNEIFMNLNHTNWIITQTLDQNRAYIGIEQALSKSAFLSIGYMNQYQSTANKQFDQVLVINYHIQLAEK